MIHPKIKQQMLASILTILPVYANAALYSITNLTADLNFGVSQAVSINDAGQVAGNIQGSGAFIAQNGVRTQLSPFFTAVGINASGQVAGYNDTHSLIFSNGAITTINNSLGGSSAYAASINDSGTVTGRADLPNTRTRAFTSAGGPTHSLGVLTGGELGSSNGYAINNNGVVTGDSYTYLSPSYAGIHAFISQDDQMLDLGTLGGSYSRGYAINDSNQVAGESLHADGTMHAFIVNNLVMTNLGRLGEWSSASGINNAGQVVGRFDLGQGNYRAFATIDGVMTDLNTLVAANSGWTLLHATDVNNSGQIVGYGIAPNGYVRAFLLDRINAVPVPGAVWLFASVLLGFARLNVRNKG